MTRAALALALLLAGCAPSREERTAEAVAECRVDTRRGYEDGGTVLRLVGGEWVRVSSEGMARCRAEPMLVHYEGPCSCAVSR